LDNIIKSQNTISAKEVVAQTKQWINDVVIALNFCPFAKSVFEKRLICYRAANNKTLEEDLISMLALCKELDQNIELETGFIIYPSSYLNFDDYLDFLELANKLLIEQQYEGIYQLASFHPDYCFDNTESNASENYTNRSPYPMLHVLRESSLENALESYNNPEEIPARNIEVANTKGAVFFEAVLEDIKNTKKNESD